MLVRQAQAGDYPGLYTVIRAAFVTDAEAKLVEKLRDCEACLLSLVAVEGERVVGHVLFSKVSISHCKKNLLVAGLAPMAVLPEWQNRGIGTELVKEGLRQCLEAGIDAVFVLGYPEYYSRFGFQSSIKFGIESDYEVPPEVFMVTELTGGCLEQCTGKVLYHPIFDQV